MDVETIRKPAPTCATCRFGQPSPPSPRMPRACRHPQMEYLRDPVSGWLPLCSEARAGNSFVDCLCGPGGKYWEPVVERPKRSLVASIWRVLRENT